MKTLYNLETSVNQYPPKNCDIDMFIATLKCYEEQGLISKFHVKETGLMKEGFDSSCENIINGEFELNYDAPRKTMEEFIQHAKLTTSGFDDLKMECLAMGELVSEILKKSKHYDSEKDLYEHLMGSTPPLNIYSFHLSTPLGWQSAHLHHDQGRGFGIIQLWKPEEHGKWCDGDQFKNYIVGKTFESYDFTTIFDLPNTQPLLIRRLKVMWSDFLNRSKKKECELCKKLFDEYSKNPDNIFNFPFKE